MHIPKTAGSAIKNYLASEYPEKIEYVSSHRPRKFLEMPGFEYAKDYTKVALIREPARWWKSWYNYHLHKKRMCPITHTTFTNPLKEYNLRKFKIKDINQAIQDSLDLTAFFENIGIELLRRRLKIHRTNHVNTFINNYNITPEFFNHQSIYSFYINNMIDEDTVVFRYEDQFEEFLDFMEIPKPPRDNVTPYKKDYDQKTLDLIYEKERNIYERFYPDIKLP